LACLGQSQDGRADWMPTARRLFSLQPSGLVLVQGLLILQLVPDSTHVEKVVGERQLGRRDASVTELGARWPWQAPCCKEHPSSPPRASPYPPAWPPDHQSSGPRAAECLQFRSQIACPSRFSLQHPNLHVSVCCMHHPLGVPAGWPNCLIRAQGAVSSLCPKHTVTNNTPARLAEIKRSAIDDVNCPHGTCAEGIAPTSARAAALPRCPCTGLPSAEFHHKSPSGGLSLGCRFRRCQAAFQDFASEAENATADSSPLPRYAHSTSQGGREGPAAGTPGGS
jgi:hypothetical protein